MAIHFRKSKTIGGFRFNFGKKGLSSVSFGKKGARISIDKKGKISRTIGIPGTGIYSRETIGNLKIPKSSNVNKTTSNTGTNNSVIHTTAIPNVSTDINTVVETNNISKNNRPVHSFVRKFLFIASIILFIFAIIMLLGGILADGHPAEIIGIPLFFAGFGCFFFAKYKHSKTITSIICIGISIFGLFITAIAPSPTVENNNKTSSTKVSVPTKSDTTSKNTVSTNKKSISSTENTSTKNENASSKISSDGKNSSKQSGKNNSQNQNTSSTNSVISKSSSTLNQTTSSKSTSNKSNTSSSSSKSNTNSSSSRKTTTSEVTTSTTSNNSQLTVSQSSNTQSQASYTITVKNELSFSRNEFATVNIEGKPNTEYNIEVYYTSGASTAEGLENKISDSNGCVSWTWKIGGRTKPGTYSIVIKGGNETIKKSFTVN